MTKAIPEGFHSVTPMVMFKDARRAMEFYKLAFGATERFAMPGPDGKGIVHAELQIGDSILMMGEENPTEPCKSAESMEGSPVSFYIYLEDVDGSFQRALEAGAETKMPVQDMFWGDRVGTVLDPFGYSWSLATHTKDPTPREVQEGAKAACAQMTKQ
jgi:uncharacterized glyoxalase superfamily protein PhnB